MAATTLRDRALIRLSGEDVRGFLQGLVTQDMAGALPQWTALLTPQGKCLFDFFVWGDPAGGEDVLIDCETGQREALARRLSMYRLRRAIAIGEDDALAVHWAADGAVAGASPDPRLSALGWRWLAAAGEGDAADGYRAHRLALGVTEGLAELGAGETLWLEANAAELHGVSFSKGCYVGQENTARMNWRQKVNRRLVVVPLAEADPARQRLALPELGPELGWSIEHRRVADIPAAAWRDWMGPRGEASDAAIDSSSGLG